MTPSKSALLRLESLDNRIVPAVVDISSYGANAALSSGAIVHRMDEAWGATNGDAAEGTGGFWRVVRMDANGTQQGYNTDARPLQFNELNTNTTRSLQLNRVALVTVNGTQYREFVLNVNQTVKNPFVNLDEVRVYLGNTGSLTGYNAATKQLAGQTAVYDLDAVTNDSIRIKAIRNEVATGPGEIALLIPESAFAGATGDTYVYLYSKFSGANGGAEAWGTRSSPLVAPPPPPPPAATGSISGQVIVHLNNNTIVEGLGNVFLELRVTDANGVTTVVGNTTTDVFGNYSFTDLAEGNYTVLEYQPSDYLDGDESVGSAGGTVVVNPDTGFLDGFQISLGAGVNALDYIFNDHDASSPPGG